MTKDLRQLYLPVEEFLAAAQKTRSPLDWYYEQNYRDLLEGLEAGGGRVNDWQGVAEVLAERGIMDATGKPPTKETARQTWIRVNKRITARQKAQAARGVKTNGHRAESGPTPEQEPTNSAPLFRSVSEPKRSEP